MRAAPSLLSAVVVALAIGAMLPSCFRDLEPARVCPPPTKREATACAPALSTQALGCGNPSTHECVLGPRDSCACGGEKECPPDPGACYPDGDCPLRVREGAPDARCIRSSRDAFLTGVPEGCICGCVACALICDGVGVSIGAKIPEGTKDPITPLLLNVTLPEKGRLGIYLRIRGAASVAIAAVGRDNKAIYVEPFALGDLPAWQERTFDVPTAWTQAIDAPTRVGIVFLPGPTSAEVDCIIPYVRP